MAHLLVWKFKPESFYLFVYSLSAHLVKRRFLWCGGEPRILHAFRVFANPKGEAIQLFSLSRREYSEGGRDFFWIAAVASLLRNDGATIVLQTQGASMAWLKSHSLRSPRTPAYCVFLSSSTTIRRPQGSIRRTRSRSRSGSYL